jgi:hypothetical protein
MATCNTFCTTSAGVLHKFLGQIWTSTHHIQYTQHHLEAQTLCIVRSFSSIAPPARFFQLFAPFSIGCGKPFSWNLIDRPKDSRMQWGWPVYAEMLCWGVISACENSGKWRHASAFDWNLAKAVSGWINGHWSFRSYPILLSFHNNEKWVPSRPRVIIFLSFRASYLDVFGAFRIFS